MSEKWWGCQEVVIQYTARTWVQRAWNWPWGHSVIWPLRSKMGKRCQCRMFMSLLQRPRPKSWHQLCNAALSIDIFTAVWTIMVNSWAVCRMMQKWLLLLGLKKPDITKLPTSKINNPCIWHKKLLFFSPQQSYEYQIIQKMCINICHRVDTRFRNPICACVRTQFTLKYLVIKILDWKWVVNKREMSWILAFAHTTNYLSGEENKE
jgi:hypothetical protein